MGVVFMVCSVTLLALVDPADIPPLIGKGVANFISIGSWLVPITFTVLGYLWGRAKKRNQALSGDDTGVVDRAVNG